MGEILHMGSDAAFALGVLAVFFIALSAVTKGRSALSDAFAGRRETRTNLTIWLFDAIFVAPFVILPAVLVGSWMSFPQLPALPVWFTILLAAVAGDFVGYWRHRLQHSRWLWPAHATHHSDRHMSWLTLERMHPLDRLGTATIDSLVLMALGFPPFAIIANGMIRNWYGHLIHADVPWSYGRMSAIFISPVAHRWHHSRDLAGVNFATIFSVWDRAFGTFVGASVRPARLGIDEESKNFIGEMLRPLEVLFATLRRLPRQKVTPPMRSSQNAQRQEARVE